MKPKMPNGKMSPKMMEMAEKMMKDGGKKGGKSMPKPKGKGK